MFQSGKERHESDPRNSCASKPLLVSKMVGPGMLSRDLPRRNQLLQSSRVRNSRYVNKLYLYIGATSYLLSFARELIF